MKSFSGVRGYPTNILSLVQLPLQFLVEGLNNSTVQPLGLCNKVTKSQFMVLFLFNYVFIYLAVPGLSHST